MYIVAPKYRVGTGLSIVSPDQSSFFESGSAQHFKPYDSASFEVFATLLSLLFQVPGLGFEKPLDHFEAFSGKMSVTKAEWHDARIISTWIAF